MRDYLAGFVFGATVFGALIVGAGTVGAGTYGNFNPSVSIPDASSRVTDVRGDALLTAVYGDN